MNIGLLNGLPAEYDALNFFANKTNEENNVSVVFTNFNMPENISLFDQGRSF